MKNKPLEVYERINDYCCLNVNRSISKSKEAFEGTEYKSVDDLVYDLEALKKYLTAFNIIEEKRVDVYKLFSCFEEGGLEKYNNYMDMLYLPECYLTQDEYNLLKKTSKKWMVYKHWKKQNK